MKASLLTPEQAAECAFVYTDAHGCLCVQTPRYPVKEDREYMRTVGFVWDGQDEVYRIPLSTEIPVADRWTIIRELVDRGCIYRYSSHVPARIAMANAELIGDAIELQSIVVTDGYSTYSLLSR